MLLIQMCLVSPEQVAQLDIKYYTVYYYLYLHKVGVLGISDCYYCVNFLDQLLLFIIVKLHVPFGQPCFPCSVLDENEPDLRN